MAALENKCKAAGITYRKGANTEASKYSFSYIPHIVVADSAGKELHAFQAKNVIAIHEANKLADTVLAKAKSFQ